ncbi:hypothetical protein KUCAC02_033801, partial [Chaenocephalus aceratus]
MPRCVSDGISLTGLPINSPLRHVLKSRSENKTVGSESGRAEYSHIKRRTQTFNEGTPVGMRNDPAVIGDGSTAGEGGLAAQTCFSMPHLLGEFGHFLILVFFDT